MTGNKFDHPLFKGLSHYRRHSPYNIAPSTGENRSYTLPDGKFVAKHDVLDAATGEHLGLILEVYHGEKIHFEVAPGTVQSRTTLRYKNELIWAVAEQIWRHTRPAKCILWSILRMLVLVSDFLVGLFKPIVIIVLIVWVAMSWNDLQQIKLNLLHTIETEWLKAPSKSP